MVTLISVPFNSKSLRMGRPSSGTGVVVKAICWNVFFFLFVLVG